MPNEFSVRLVPAKMAGVVSPRGGGESEGGGSVTSGVNCKKIRKKVKFRGCQLG